MNALVALEIHFEDHKDRDGKPVNVMERISEACDRTRMFYVGLAAEMRGYMQSETPVADFRRKTNLPEREFGRRLRMLGIQ